MIVFLMLVQKIAMLRNKELHLFNSHYLNNKINVFTLKLVFLFLKSKLKITWHIFFPTACLVNPESYTI